MDVALDVLTDLHERITGTKKNDEPEEPIYHPENMNGSILRIDRGKSFKGHEAAVSINHEGNKLHICNKYLTGWCNYSYDTDAKTTQQTFRHEYQLPKWLIQKQKDIVNYHSLTTDCIQFIIRKGMKIELTSWSVIIMKDKEIEGLKMFGHRNNINMLRDLQQIGSKFRKWIKATNVESLAFDKPNIKQHTPFMDKPITFKGKLHL
jgi:hypothetical protein